MEMYNINLMGPTSGRLLKEDNTIVNFAETITADGYLKVAGLTNDREIVLTTYRAKVAFTGASIGDIITATRILDVSGANAVQVGATVWYNETTSAALASVPSSANIEIAGQPSLTDAQLRASAVAVSAASLPLPTGAATATNQTTANTSLASLDTKVPTLSTTSLAGKNRLDVTLAAAGTAGSTAPTVADMVGGTDGTNLRALSVDTSGRLNTVTASATIMQPVDIQSRFSQTIQTQNAVSVAANGGAAYSAWVDCAGFDSISVTLVNDAATSCGVTIFWSNDGANDQGPETMLAQAAARYRIARTTVKARYVRISPYNSDTIAHTMSTWTYLIT